MFKFHAPPVEPPVTLVVDGRSLRVPARISVAAALLGCGFDSIRRTPVAGAARGPWCLMGACFDCLVTIDGVRDLQACLTTVRHDMRIELQMPDPGERGEQEPDPWESGP